MAIFKPNASRETKVLITGFLMTFLGVVAVIAIVALFPDQYEMPFIPVSVLSLPGLALMLIFWFKAPKYACKYDRGLCDGHCRDKKQRIICPEYGKCSEHDLSG